MPPEPIDKRNALKTRDALWAAMRELREFSVREVRNLTCCSMDQAREYITSLLAAGYVVKTGRRNAKRAAIYQLVMDKAGAVAPRVRKDGSPVTQGIGRDQMWRAMRVLGTFTVQDLIVHATTEDHAVAYKEADTYCQFLARAGYLGRRGKAYQFIRSRYSGPRPPMIQRIKQVYDPNLNTVVWSQGGNHDAE